MSRVAIIAAMADELRPLVRTWTHESSSGVDLWRGRRGDAECVAACAGAGVDAAARAFAEIEKGGTVDCVVSTGWAGALREEFGAGRAFGVSEVIDSRTGERFSVAGRSGVCRLVTSHRVADEPEKRRLAATFCADLVDMEAAAIGRLASMRGVPFYCVKGVSDGVADRLPDFNGFISADGRFQRRRFILFALLRPWYWNPLVRLGRDSRIAARGATESVLGILEGLAYLR